MRENKASKVFTIIAVTMFLSFSIAGGYIILHWIYHTNTYSKFQTDENVKKNYDACAAHSPEGFSCIVIPMMVSDEAAAQEGKL